MIDDAQLDDLLSATYAEVGSLDDAQLFSDRAMARTLRGIIELMWAAVVAVIVLAGGVIGCESTSAQPPDAPYPDGAPFVPGPNLVTLTVPFDEPFYIRYRDGEGTWTTPARTQPNTYELHITDAYDVVTLCGGLRNFGSNMLKRTFADGATAFQFCYSFGGSVTDPPAGNVWEVDGTMKQAGEVWFGSFGGAPFGPWSFSFDLVEGTYDLIAIGDTNMLIRRDLAITADTTVPPIDVDVDGQPLETLPFTSNAEPGVETVRGGIGLETAAEFAFIDGSATALRVPPAAILTAGDRMDAQISASTNTTNRSLSMPFTGVENVFILPPKLDRIEYTYPYRQLWATWQSLPRFTELSLRTYSFTSGASQSVSVTERYLQATRTNYLSFYPMPDDYDPRFTVDIVGPYLRSFAAHDFSETDTSRYSSLDEQVNFP